MKKTKLLLSILGISTLSSAIIPITSCSTEQNHVWLVSVDKPTKEADENYKARYYFGLDGDYETKDIKVAIDSLDKDVLIFNYFVSNNILVVQVQYAAFVEQTTKITFNLNVSTSKWTQQVGGLVLNIQINDPADLYILKRINKILANNEWCNTMNDAITLVKANGIDVENLTCKSDKGIYVWDQSANRFAIINSETGELIYGTDGYVLNESKWQLWKMVTPSEFDSYNQYSQYLKSGLTVNDSTDGVYSFISGFDAGSNTNVKNAHYFYEKMEGTQVGKDIIINTNSLNTTVDVSAWNDRSQGDLVMHFGKSSDLTIVTNYKYVEYGKVISASTFDGSITIAPDANIEMTYVRSPNVELKHYKTTGTIDEIYTDSSDSSIKTAIKNQGYEIADDHDIVSSDYQDIKEEAIEKQGVEVSHVFTVTGGTQNEYYETLSDIAAATNASNNPEYFAGKTITLNKDYDMAAESENWVSICNSYNDYNKAFLGTFDGAGHSILNFNNSKHHVALFGISKGNLKNINFVNCHRECTDGAANPLLVVRLADNCNVDNVHAYNCSIKGITNTAMIIFWIEPENSGSTNRITNCSTDKDCVVYNNTKGTQTAGIIGQACNVEHLYCENLFNNATISGCKSVGGIVGQFGDSTSYGEFKNCINNGKITMQKVASPAANTPYYTGGIIGYVNCGSGLPSDSNIKFENCQNNGDVTITATKTETLDKLTICGGFVGFTNGFTLTYTNCKNTGKIGLVEGSEGEIDCKWAGGFTGYNNVQDNRPEKYINCENAGTIHANNGVGHFAAVKTGDQQLADENCKIENGKIIDTEKRIIIPGEPE